MTYGQEVAHANLDASDARLRKEAEKIAREKRAFFVAHDDPATDADIALGLLVRAVSASIIAQAPDYETVVAMTEKTQIAVRDHVSELVLKGYNRNLLV